MSVSEDTLLCGLILLMSLDVYIQPSIEMPRMSGVYEHICDFNDDGYYWFLHPLFEDLKNKTGEYIDLFGAAAFGGDKLASFDDTIASARDLVASQSDHWSVVTGILMEEPPRNMYSEVSKQQMQTLLDKLSSAIKKARATNAFVTFWGD